MKLLRKIKRFLISSLGNSSSKVKHLRKEGARIGDNVVINGDLATFGSEPYLISCGKDCLFAYGVKIITHDGGVRVLNNLDYFKGKKVDKIQNVIIGNNVYFGMNSMIMPGVTIGDNVIIGANSVVTKDIPSNVVAVGSPAKPICSIDEYYKKNKDKFEYTIGMNYKDKKDFYLKKFNLK